MISAVNTLSLSNMAVVDEKPLADVFSETPPEFIETVVFGLEEEVKRWKVTRFGKSPKMSSYLLTFANGAFEYRGDSYTSPLTGREIPLRFYAVRLSQSPLLALSALVK
jgi:aminopeptidase 2